MMVSDKRATQLQGAAYGALACAAVLVIGGSFWPGWSLESSVQKRLEARDKATLVKVLAPVCAQKFRDQANLEAKVAEIKKIDSWKRDAYLVEAKYVIPTGDKFTDTAVGDACVDRLRELIK